MPQLKPITTNKPKTSVLSVIILVVVSILLSISIFEVVTHLIPDVMPVLIRGYFRDENIQKLVLLTSDEKLGFKFAAELDDYPMSFLNDDGSRSFYTISTVSLGYEDVGFRDDGIDNEPFAVVIGDSFAVCTSVKMEECWVERLEREIGRDFANLGVLSYGPQQMQQMLIKYGFPLEPELVLWVFYGNDPYDAWHFNQFGVAGVTEGEFWDNPARTWLIRHSSTYLILMYFWYNRHLYNNLIKIGGESISGRYKLAWWRMATDLTDPTVAEGVDLTHAAILDGKQQTLTKFNDAKFVVVVLPTREQVYATDPILQSQLDTLTDDLVNFARQHDITVIDLTSPVKEKAKNEPYLYFKRDLHLNARGNAVVAELLKQELEELLIR